ncbi:hypothetical protein [Kitasatospora sp. NPDC094016]|uniref:hypothetical protein n=1 Tax=Kitasatospora sp. NPDC094016 TaxID=3154986 RepID=UPI00331B0061
MLTITTTRKLDALRQRAAQAETALTDTTHQLETLLEQRRETGQERPDTGNDPAAVRDELEAAQRLADEAMASEARTKSVCNLVVKDASAQLAARDAAIAELRAELEQARAGQPAEPELPEHTVLQFRTLGGGLVALISRPDEDRIDDARIYGYQCLTCGGEADGAWRMEDGRRWANEHAAVCRAIPAGTADAGKAATRA